MTITLNLTPDTQEKLEALALKTGQDITETVYHLIEKGIQDELLSEDESDLFPHPPTTIRDRAHLEEMLLEGLDSGESTPMTDQDWEEIRQEVRDRGAVRVSKP